jgi:hypothetical protein
MPATGDRITKRKNGLFQGMYTVQTPDGPKRKYVYDRKYGEVQRKLAEAMGDAARGIVYDAENMTVAEYMIRWLEDSARGDLAPRTYHNYRLQIRQHISPRLRQNQARQADGGPHPESLRCQAARRIEALQRAVHPRGLASGS